MEKNYLFAGEQLDEELRNYYLRNRFYDVDTGNFIRKDILDGYRTRPLTLTDYLYAVANSATSADPSGFMHFLMCKHHK